MRVPVYRLDLLLEPRHVKILTRILCSQPCTYLLPSEILPHLLCGRVWVTIVKLQADVPATVGLFENLIQRMSPNFTCLPQGDASPQNLIANGVKRKHMWFADFRKVVVSVRASAGKLEQATMGTISFFEYGMFISSKTM